MNAPDIIYTDGMNTCATRPVFSNIDSNIKYIRADLVKLTWEDCACIMDAFFDLIQGIAAGRENPRHSKEELYKEVLRRYKEYKKERIR